MSDVADNFPHLPRAPISEAILDVQIEARKDLHVSDLRSLSDALGADFPTVNERRRFQAIFGPARAGPMPAQAKDLGVDGYLFRSADGKDVAQARIDGFTLNRLAPYPGWSEWFPLFTKLWALYADVAMPVRVVRIGARCINVIPVRSGAGLQEYLAQPPEAPDSLPATLKSFVWRVELTAGGEPEQLLTLVHLLQPAPEGGALQLVLDIDAFSVGDFVAHEVVAGFEALHALRNRAFFSSLTSEAIEAFQ